MVTAPSRPVTLAICFAVSVSVACAQPRMAAAPSQPPVDIVASQPTQQVQLRPGETFVIHPTSEAAEWELDFAPEILQLLTPPGRSRAPGPRGWEFRALAVGSTDVIITGAGSAGPAPPRRIVTVHVR